MSEEFVVTDAEYPSKQCAKAEKALYAALTFANCYTSPHSMRICSCNTFNKTRELASLSPSDWLPHVYACILFPMPPDDGVPPDALSLFEAITSEYSPTLARALCNRFYFLCKLGYSNLRHRRRGCLSLPSRYLLAHPQEKSMMDLISKNGYNLAKQTPLLNKVAPRFNFIALSTFYRAQPCSCSCSKVAFVGAIMHALMKPRSARLHAAIS